MLIRPTPHGLEAASNRHLPLLMGPALDRGGLAVACDHAHALVDARDDVVRRAGLQEGNAVLAAGRQDPVARLLHLRRERLARNGAIAKRQAEIARPDFREAEP